MTKGLVACFHVRFQIALELSYFRWFGSCSSGGVDYSRHGHGMKDTLATAQILRMVSIVRGILATAHSPHVVGMVEDALATEEETALHY